MARFRDKKSFVNHEEYSYLVNGNNDIIIPKDKYRYLGRFSEGLIAASIDGDKFGFIDIEENIIIPFMYKKNVGRIHGATSLDMI